MRQNLKTTCTIIIFSLMSWSGAVSANQDSSAKVQQMQNFLGLLQQFYGIVDSMNQTSTDPSKAAIMQLFKIQEVYEKQGKKKEAAKVFRHVLKTSTNPILRNAASIMLGDLLKETGQNDAAIKVLTKGLNENMKRLK